MEAFYKICGRIGIECTRRQAHCAAELGGTLLHKVYVNEDGNAITCHRNGRRQI